MPVAPVALTLIYSALILAGSLLGGWLPSRWTISHMRMQLILSFVGGLMLGIALLHLLPEAIQESGANTALGSTLVGLLFMFFLIRTFHFHQHGPAGGDQEAHTDCDQDHSHHHHHEAHGGPHELSWAGVATGLSVHTLIDGLALGAAVQADSHASTPSALGLWGLGTFLAIMLHKPLDAMSITSLMKASGWSSAATTAVNIGFSLMCPLGALLVILAHNTWTPCKPECWECYWASRPASSSAFRWATCCPKFSFTATTDSSCRPRCYWELPSPTESASSNPPTRTKMPLPTTCPARQSRLKTAIRRSLPFAVQRPQRNRNLQPTSAGVRMKPSRMPW